MLSMENATLVTTSARHTLTSALFPPSSPWAAWLRALITFFCVCAAAMARADTDFDRMERLAEEQYGPAAKQLLQDWRAMIAETIDMPDRAKLERTNNFVNRNVLYESDIVVWQQTDYWATPLETFGKQAGDCEDFAIAKYITLRLLDVPVHKLRLFYVRYRPPDGSRSLAHMVLSYFETPSSDPLVLDIVRGDIVPASRRPDLLPIFSFNHDGLWMEGEKRSSSKPTSRLSRWRDVLQRMRREGWDPSLSSISRRSILSWMTAKVRPALRAANVNSLTVFEPAPKRSLKKTAKVATPRHKVRAAKKAQKKVTKFRVPPRKRHRK